MRWHNENRNAGPGAPTTGTRALHALAEIHLVRGRLDRAELVAVMTAPRHGKSWSEIGIMLHKQAGGRGSMACHRRRATNDRVMAGPLGRRAAPQDWQR